MTRDALIICVQKYDGIYATAGHDRLSSFILFFVITHASLNSFKQTHESRKRHFLSPTANHHSTHLNHSV
ncbi:hypothetical protein D4764_18G0002500 [Takifugu flavidus]|uniref:Uncharacterized protein n=1 Tax=Takifugu flavidus TaxID=433684 RepID=A0A5C6NPV6_9TELE|nr:hypothetical protein D4764_18G0002500 [Takifugu flavidus]